MNSRRSLLQQAVWLLAGLAGLQSPVPAAAAAKTPLREDEPQARAVAYYLSASKVDRKKYPGFRPGQSCDNCKLMALGTGRQRVCSLFPNRVVNSGGWCNVWVRRGS